MTSRTWRVVVLLAITATNAFAQSGGVQGPYDARTAPKELDAAWPTGDEKVNRLAPEPRFRAMLDNRAGKELPPQTRQYATIPARVDKAAIAGQLIARPLLADFHVEKQLIWSTGPNPPSTILSPATRQMRDAAVVTEPRARWFSDGNEISTRGKDFSSTQGEDFRLLKSRDN